MGRQVTPINSESFHNLGQGWVARKPRDMLLNIWDENIHKVFVDFLTAHERSIGLAETRSSDWRGLPEEG
jgi:hypothetical protein